MDLCYKCNIPSSSREHVPPKSFFPDNKRLNLITVPSCKKHNIENSSDVEYVRNILTCFIQANNYGLHIGITKTLRSFKRSVKLLISTFRERTPVIVEGSESSLIKYDSYRFNNIMKSIGDAIYYHEYQQCYKYDWKVFNCSAFDINEFKTKQTSESLNIIRLVANNIKFDEVSTSNPEIFKYYKKKEGDKLCYKFVFYGGVEILLLSNN